MNKKKMERAMMPYEGLQREGQGIEVSGNEEDHIVLLKIL
jgi:hypothetical protein